VWPRWNSLPPLFTKLINVSKECLKWRLMLWQSGKACYTNHCVRSQQYTKHSVFLLAQMMLPKFTPLVRPNIISSSPTTRMLIYQLLCPGNNSALTSERNENLPPLCLFVPSVQPCTCPAVASVPSGHLEISWWNIVRVTEGLILTQFTKGNK